MTVFLTSFKVYHERYGQPPTWKTSPVGYSIAVYQPGWFPQLPKIDLFDIRDEHGRWTRPRDFINEYGEPSSGTEPRDPDPELLRRYHDTLLGMYEKRWTSGRFNEDPLPYPSVFASRVDGIERNVALCCWCPYDKAAKRQLADYGSFVCHSWPVETFLLELGVPVVRDIDRERMVRL